MLGPDAYRSGPRGLILFALVPETRLLAEEIVRFAEDEAKIWAFSPQDSSWRQLQGEAWEETSWPKNLAFTMGLEHAVRSIFRRDQDVADRRVDLVFLEPPANPQTGDPPPDFLSIQELTALKRRFQRIDRIFFTHGNSFKTYGDSRIAGMLEPLPWKRWVESGIVDFILLQDQVNIKDQWFGGEEEAHRHLALLIQQLTIGPMAFELYYRLQQEREQQGVKGAYVGAGCAVWRLSPTSAPEATARLLTRQMAAATVEASQEQDEQRLPVDTWPNVEELEQLPDPNQEVELLKAHEDTAFRSLRELFETEHKPGALTRLVDQRLEKLRRVESRVKLQLMNFMNEFAPWYARHKAGLGRKKPDVGPPEPIVHSKPRRLKIALCIFSFLALMFCTWAYIDAEYLTAGTTPEPLIPQDWALGSGLFFLLVGIALLVTGLSEEELEYPDFDPPKPEPEWLKLLDQRRAGLWIVQQLIQSHEGLLQSVRQQVKSARRILPGGQEEERMIFPFTSEVCDQLLVDFKLDAEASLTTFWEQEEKAWRQLIQGGEAGWLDLLETFARKRCQEKIDVDWELLMRLLGGSKATEAQAWRDGVSKLKRDSLPCLPVSGRASWEAVLIPEDLHPELAKALKTQLGMSTLVRQNLRGRVMAIQISQGYETAPKHVEALALEEQKV